AAGREVFGTEGCELRDVKLSNPCFLAPDGPLWAHSAFDPDAATFRVHTRPALGASAWTAHLTASLRPLPAGSDGVVFSPDAVRRGCPREHSRERSYAYLRSIALDYGPTFQGIDAVWQGDRESLGSVRLPEPLGREEDDYLFPPAVLDACLQVAIPADPDF